jgi:hypothetical protein
VHDQVEPATIAQDMRHRQDDIDMSAIVSRRDSTSGRELASQKFVDSTIHGQAGDADASAGPEVRNGTSIKRAGSLVDHWDPPAQRDASKLSAGLASKSARQGKDPSQDVGTYRDQMVPGGEGNGEEIASLTCVAEEFGSRADTRCTESVQLIKYR